MLLTFSPGGPPLPSPLIDSLVSAPSLASSLEPNLLGVPLEMEICTEELTKGHLIRTQFSLLHSPPPAVLRVHLAMITALVDRALVDGDFGNGTRMQSLVVIHVD